VLTLQLLLSNITFTILVVIADAIAQAFAAMVAPTAPIAQAIAALPLAASPMAPAVDMQVIADAIAAAYNAELEPA
jgi:hypothetical protein